MSITIKGGSGSSSISSNTSGVVVEDTTGAFTVPAGTTAERPASPTVGMIRYNTTLSYLEQYNGTAWTEINADEPPAPVVTPAAVSDQTNTSTGYFDVPSGTTAQRPGTPSTGMLRYNTDTSALEVYGADWTTIQPTAYEASVLIVAGGGGGGGSTYSNTRGGGGGAGGLLYFGNETPNAGGPITLTPNATYAVAVGAGGPGSGSTTNIGLGAFNGSNSTFGATVAIGGGAGANWSGNAGQDGGSGGGGTTGNLITPGSGTAGQGYAGGVGEVYQNNTNTAGGGGGGAGGAGEAASTDGTGHGGDGGPGLSYDILGYTSSYAGGGGGGGGIAGGTATDNGGSGVIGVNNGFNGSTNTGGGGGGSAVDGSTNTGRTGGNGGSGIVIIRYAGPQRGTGGDIITNNSYTIHIFRSSGVFTA